MLTGIVRPQTFPDLPSGWSAEGATWKSPVDGLELFETTFRDPRRTPKRVLAIIHGGGEHGGRYQHFAHYLGTYFDVVAAMDHRGCGRSSGTRGHIESFDEFTTDVLAWLERLHVQFPEARIDVLGHSLGGLIALRVLQKNNPSGVSSWVISAPLIELSMPVPGWKRMVGNSLSRIWGDLQIQADIPVEKVSRDPALIRAHGEDRLIHDKATPRFFTEMQRAAALVKSWTGPVDVPVLFLLPTQDGVVSFPAARTFAENLRDARKQIEILDGYFHESFNDLGKEAVFEKMIKFFVNT